MATAYEKLQKRLKEAEKKKRPDEMDPMEYYFNAKMRAMENKLGGVKQLQEKPVFDFYLTEQEQKQAELKETSTGQDILDFIDNLNRPFYAVTGGVHEFIKSVKYEDEHAGKVIADVGEAMWKGLKREDRKFARDILKLIKPEFVKEVEDKTSFKVLGYDALEMDAASVPLFLTDVLMDPLTYVPFGLFFVLGKKAMGMGGKGLRISASKIIGQEATEKIFKEGSDKFFKTYGKIFDKRASMKHIGHEEEFKLIENARRYGEAKGRVLGKEFAKVPTGEKNGVINKWRTMTKEEAEVIDRAMFKMEDDMFRAQEDRISKVLGMAVDDVAEHRSLMDALHAIKNPATNDKELYRILSWLDKEAMLQKKGVGKLVKEAVSNRKKTKKLANYMAKIDHDATMAWQGHRLSRARKIRKAALDRVAEKKKALESGIKSGMKVSFRLLKDDVSTVMTQVNDLEKALGGILKGEVHPQAMSNMRHAVNQLEKEVQFLNKWQVDEISPLLKRVKITEKYLPRKRMKKQISSWDTVRNISRETKDLLAVVKRLEVEGITKLRKDVVQTLNKNIKGIKDNLKGFHRLRMAELGTLKGTVKETEILNRRLYDVYKKQIGEMVKEIKNVEKYAAGEALLYRVAQRKLGKYRDKMSKQYEKVFNILGSGSTHRKIINMMVKEKEEIFERGLKELPKELHEPARFLRRTYDEFEAKGTAGDDPFLRGSHFLYNPRVLETPMVGTVKAAYPGRMAEGTAEFTKKRKIGLTAQYEKYVEEMGGKIEHDAAFKLVKYAQKFEMKYAKHQVEKSLLEKYGINNISQLPDPELYKTLNYLYSEGATRFNNEVLEGAFRLYGKGLNVTKLGLTVANPAFYGRNIFGFPFLAATVAGVKGAFVHAPGNFADALRLITGSKGNLKIGKKVYKLDDIRKVAEETGYWGSSFMRGDIKQSLNNLLKRYPAYSPKRWMAEFFNFSMKVEDFGRYGALVACLKAGYPLKLPKGVKGAKLLPGATAGLGDEIGIKAFARKQSAPQAAELAMFNYNLINSPADKALQGLFGFYTFSRRNLPRQVMTMLNDPKQYSMTARILNKISNREDLSKEEVGLLNWYEKETFKIFGEAIDGVREFTTLGFTPIEEAYQTVNALTSWKKSRIAGRANPLVTSFLDYWYNKDSFYGTDFASYLPPRYNHIITPGLAKSMGLTKRTRTKWRGGEEIGVEEVYYGDPDVIAALRKFPPTCRFLNDIANLLQGTSEGKELAEIVGYTTGVKVREMDIEKRKRMKKYQKAKALARAAKAKGAKEFRRIYIPFEQKPSTSLEEMKRKKKRWKERLLRGGE